MPEAAVRLRPATVEDAATMAEIHVGAWQTAFRGIVPDELLNALRPEEIVVRYREPLAANDAAAQRFTVAVSDRAVIGLVRCAATRDGDEDPACVGEVRSLYVRPRYWRQGVGRRLLHAAIEQLVADGFDTATLWTLTASKQARAFYEALGWRLDGAVTEWEGVPRVRYRAQLSAANSVAGPAT